MGIGWAQEWPIHYVHEDWERGPTQGAKLFYLLFYSDL